MAAASLLGQAPVEPISRLNCRAVAVNGATVDFPFESTGAGDARQARLPIGSTAFVEAVDRVFIFTGLPGSLAFDVTPVPGNAGYFDATVYLAHNGGAGLPIAHGYCTERAITGGQAPQLSLSQLDDALLLEAAETNRPCYLTTLTGQVSRFETHIEGQERVIEPGDQVVWSSRRASMTTSPPSPPLRPGVLPRYFEIFGGRDGDEENPVGYAVHHLDQERSLAVTTILFTRLGTDPSPERHNAMSVCVFRVRRR